MSYQGIAEGFTDQGSITPQNLIAGEFPRVSRTVTVTGNGILPIGSVLGCIDQDGRYQLSVASAEDGSQVPDAILAETIGLNSGDQQAVVYFSGEFNAFALHLGEGHSIDSLRTHFRRCSIFLRQNQPV